MQFKPNALITAFVLAITAGVPAHAGLADFFKSEPKKGAETAGLFASAADAGVKTQPIDGDSKEVPDWLRDSKRLETMLGAEANFKIKDPRVIRTMDAPFPGLLGYVVEATSYSDANPDGKKELFVFYTDKSKRYLMVGMMIDMQKNRDVNLDVERYVRGELADNPAKALRPQDMHGIQVPGSSSSTPLTFVVDLGKKAGRDGVLNLVRLHQTISRAGTNVRPLRIVLVSAGHDEYATAAMAIAYGYETISGNGLAKVLEFSEKGSSVSWLQRQKVNKDTELKRVLGTGIFKMEDNSTQALLARLDTLPLVYVGQGERTVNIPLPSSQADWKALITK